MSGEQPDLGQIHTRAEFKGALERLRAGRSYAALDKAAEGRLPKSTVSDLLNPDKGLPDETTLEALLRACGVPPHQESAWLKARKRVLGGGDPRTAGLIRVAKAEPRRLGVHAAIDVPGADGELPAYVERDTDTAPRGVRTLIGNAAEGGRGGLVVLVGSSSVGKTRCAFEAIRARVPDWWLLHPSDTAQIRAIAADPPARLVVWLDELQRYLDGVDGLQAGTVRALLAQGAVLVATLWPDRYDIYTALPQPGQQDTHAHERELLSLADVVDIAERFTPDERVRAEQIAADGDVRLAVALHSDDYGLTQTIAAAPQLMRRWRQADAYAAAVLTAAVDATRLGVDSPLPAALLLQAAPGYCDPRQSAKAPSNWFENALAYLTEELHGAASALTPIASPRGGMGQTTGYRVADYLQQHAQAERRHAKIPATCWQALTDHLTDPSEQTQVAGAACDRLLYRYADRLYCNATQTGAPPAGLQWIDLLARRENVEELRLHADAGDWYAAERLARLLAERGEVEELRARADAAGDWNAAGRLAGLLAERGEVEELRARADAGDQHAAFRLARLLAERGEVEELRARADAGDRYAADGLAGLLAERGEVERLRARADAGDQHAAFRLARLLAERGEVEELRARADTGDPHAADRLARLSMEWRERGEVEELRARADAGDRYAADGLAGLLAERGEVERLRARADAGDQHAAFRLARLLAERGEVEELRARADTGDPHAADRLARLSMEWRERGEVEELRARADTGDQHAAFRLARLLAERGEVEELRARADAGDRYAADGLAGLLAERGEVERLRARADAGDQHAAFRLARLLAERGEVEELRARADTGDPHAADRLARLSMEWRERGEVEELRARADAGDRYAADGLAGLLAERGEVERLRARADAGDQHAAFRLARLLAERGEVEELRARADTGDPHAADRLARLSMEWRERGEVEELRARADTGDQHAAFRLARLLAERGEVEELRARADTGDRYAAGRLIDLLAQRGEVEELRARADTGDRYAADRLAGLLVERGEVEELRARVDAGEPYAANWLIAALVKRGQVEEAERLRRYGLEAE